MERNNLQQRKFEVKVRENEPETESKEQWVEGYAVVFDSPTVLFEIDGEQYKEQICRGAFDSAAMDDVIFNYNHGSVIARTRNNTLELKIDEKGLFVRARVDETEAGRNLYEQVRGGYVDKMSFAFTVNEESFDESNNQWNVRKIKRLFDVSAVDMPAYDDTSLQARRKFVMDEQEQKRKEQADKEKAEQERKTQEDLKKRKLILKIKLGGNK